MAEAAAAAAGNILSGVGGYEASKFNKKQDDAAALAQQQDGADQEQMIREKARMAIGSQLAGQGESGFQQGTGSAIDALAQSQINATLDALTIRRQAAAKARDLRVKGDVAEAQGKNALISGMLGAVGKGAAGYNDWASSRPAGGSSGSASGGYGAGLVNNDPSMSDVSFVG